MNSKYEAKTFNIPELKGISKISLNEHIKLYEGYVKNTNFILEEIKTNKENSSYAQSEMQRRFAFEFNGMKNHEVYFSSLEDGSCELSNKSNLKKEIENTFNSYNDWLKNFKSLAKTRGVGWAILYYDPSEGILLNSWVGEQHIGQLSGCHTILALDMWEHSFVADYQSSGKNQYIEDFFENLNWSVIENNFKEVTS